MMLAVASCVDSPAVSEFKHLDAEGWHRRDTVILCIQRGDTASVNSSMTAMHLHLMLRALPVCDINGVTLLAEVVERTDPRCSRFAHTPHRQVIMRDTIPFTLASSVTSTSTTSSSSSTGLSIRCLDSQRDMSFPLYPDRSYFLRIIHLMRLDPILGLTEVGFLTKED